jgi:acetyl-CoA carboxylase biotin carboxyl carrier protein
MSNVKGPSESIDTRLIRKLADILRDTELSEIEVEHGDLKIRVARELTAAPINYQAAPVQYAQAPTAAPVAAVAAPVAEPARGEITKSPMVGTCYLSPQPGADAFIKVGDRVKEGQTLLIIEAMKTMNPIPSPKDGVVLEILATDGKPVEYGEPLVVID